MAGFVMTHNGTVPFWHTFPPVNPSDVVEVQLDGDELAFGLTLWPTAGMFTASPTTARVRCWHGASARRFACKFLDNKFANQED